MNDTFIEAYYILIPDVYNEDVCKNHFVNLLGIKYREHIAVWGCLNCGYREDHRIVEVE